MKAEIHPNYHQITFKCACGAKYPAGSTIKNDEFQTEICSACHPFFTGKQKLLDTSGRVDKFRAKTKAAEEYAKKTPSKKGKKGVKIEKIEDAEAEITTEIVEETQE